MYAILRAGGKQIKVAPGDVVRIERSSEKKAANLEKKESAKSRVQGGKLQGILAPGLAPLGLKERCQSRASQPQGYSHGW